MSDSRSNIVQLWRHGFPARDVESIETLLLVATGDEVSIEDVEVTGQSLEELAAHFDCSPAMALNGMIWPLWRWSFDLEGVALDLFVIDAGRYRAFYYKARERRGPPLKAFTGFFTPN